MKIREKNEETKKRKIERKRKTRENGSADQDI